MITRYQKPVSRDLGSNLPNAHGVCWTGSVANLGMPGAGAPNCFSGGDASGSGCGFGQTPGTNACSVGLTPQYFGCGEGLGAIAPCSVGGGVI